MKWQRRLGRPLPTPARKKFWRPAKGGGFVPTWYYGTKGYRQRHLWSDCFDAFTNAFSGQRQGKMRKLRSELMTMARLPGGIERRGLTADMVILDAPPSSLTRKDRHAD